MKKNNLKIIRQKLDSYLKAYINKELLIKILDKFAPNYSIKNLTNL